MTNNAAQEFSVCAILSVTNGQILDNRKKSDVYLLLGFILERPATHVTLNSDMVHATFSLLKEHHDLVNHRLPDLSGMPVKRRNRKLRDWLKAKTETLGTTLPVRTKSSTAHLPNGPRIPGMIVIGM